jgi:formylmethanofuran dehydrogenase subunit E
VPYGGHLCPQKTVGYNAANIAGEATKAGLKATAVVGVTVATGGTGTAATVVAANAVKSGVKAHVTQSQTYKQF